MRLRHGWNLFIANNVSKLVFEIGEQKNTTKYIFHFSIGCFFFTVMKNNTATKRYMRCHYCGGERGAQRRQLLISKHDLFTISRSPHLLLMPFQSIAYVLATVGTPYVHNATGRGHTIKS